MKICKQFILALVLTAVAVSNYPNDHSNQENPKKAKNLAEISENLCK